MLRPLALVLTLYLAFGPALAQVPARKPDRAAPPVDHAAEYRACMRLAREAPQEGFDGARAWQNRGGGLAAEHCAAVALLGLERPEEAADALEALAVRAAAERPELRVPLLAQAGQAWLRAGQPGRARTVLSTALNLAPDSIELLIDRSIAHAGEGAWAAAVSDLDRVLALSPERVDALVLRASAKRRLADLAGAAADLERALALEPDDPDARLERGLLRRAAGDLAGARADFEAVVAEAPGSPSADSARLYLERLDR